MKHAIAALILTAGAVYAESTPRLKANIPFSFTVGGTQMAPGHYETTAVAMSSGSRMLMFANRDTRESKLSMASSPLYANQGTDQTKLVFECVAKSCALSQVWSGSTGMQFTTPPRRKNAPTHVTEIQLHPITAE